MPPIPPITLPLGDLRATALRHAGSWRAVSTRHDLLLRIAAYPPTPEHRTEALKQLDQIGALVRKLPATARRRGDDSGVAGTRSQNTYDLGVARWLCARYLSDIEVDWPQLDSATLLEDLIRPALQRAEEDGFDSDHLSLRVWVREARGDSLPSDLSWILSAMNASRRAPAHLAASWESAEIPLAWKLRDSSASAAAARRDVGRVVARAQMRTTPKNSMRHIAAPLRGITRLPRAAAEQVITVARITLAARCREVHAISYANNQEVWMAPLGAGAELAIIGVVPEHRLTLEANYGYVLFSNGIPVGYGGVSPLFRQANTGINIFEAFRGTEAGFLWTQTLRAFRTLFGVRRFVVSPFQIGGGNAEALRSGAFWFHYRLGFRPATPELRELAVAESIRMRRKPKHRTPLGTLRRLASTDLHLTLPGFDERDAFDESWLPRLSVLVSRRIGATGRAASREPANSTLAPFAALLPDLAQWPRVERQHVRKLLDSKDAHVERDFVLATQENPRFFRGLIALARTNAGH